MADLNLIDEVPSSRQTRRGYDLWSLCYDKVAGPWHHGPRLRGLEAADLRDGEDVLDVGTGTGAMPLKILDRWNQAIRVFGVDFSLGMLAKARRKIVSGGYSNAYLLAADALALPFPDCAFQVVYSAYALDLLTLQDVSAALAEFWRVLKPDGRLILVNMSKC